MKVTRKTPETVAPPIGAYSHLSILPRDADLLFLAGQIGADPEGNVPEKVEEQFRNALANVENLLKSEGVTPEAILKINFWFTESPDRAQFLAIWNEFHGGNPPPTTLAYVSALAQPAIKVEVEAWAARK
ncbi:RidA family protein [Brevibacillus reuszeri]|uniref:RidA family protein n=1 Tax=Brevibacillus reuszeri TaxID=54915 RepID=UPI00289E0FF2|nr:RidA family protein [Brevibacillus reuszeri]